MRGAVGTEPLPAQQAVSAPGRVGQTRAREPRAQTPAVNETLRAATTSAGRRVVELVPNFAAGSAKSLSALWAAAAAIGSMIGPSRSLMNFSPCCASPRRRRCGRRRVVVEARGVDEQALGSVLEVERGGDCVVIGGARVSVLDLELLKVCDRHCSSFSSGTRHPMPRLKIVIAQGHRGLAPPYLLRVHQRVCVYGFAVAAPSSVLLVAGTGSRPQTWIRFATKVAVAGLKPGALKRSGCGVVRARTRCSCSPAGRHRAVRQTRRRGHYLGSVHRLFRLPERLRTSFTPRARGRSSSRVRASLLRADDAAGHARNSYLAVFFVGAGLGHDCFGDPSRAGSSTC